MAIEVSTAELWIVTANEETIVPLDPLQGLWTEAQYLKMTDYSHRLLEFVDGVLEILPMPSQRHQVISAFLFAILMTLMQRTGGKVLYAPLSLQVREGKYREPDLLLLRDAADPRRKGSFWRGADLVIEIVSPDNPERDTVVKRADYAEADIPEYWIVNPEDETITVLRLRGVQYAEHAVFHRGAIAASFLIPGFAVAVSDVFDAE